MQAIISPGPTRRRPTIVYVQCTSTKRRAPWRRNWTVRRRPPAGGKSWPSARKKRTTNDETTSVCTHMSVVWLVILSRWLPPGFRPITCLSAACRHWPTTKMQRFVYTQLYSSNDSTDKTVKTKKTNKTLKRFTELSKVTSIISYWHQKTSYEFTELHFAICATKTTLLYQIYWTS